MSKLYHGTTEAVAKAACVNGLDVYESEDFDHGMPRTLKASSDDGICLTTSYPGVMALNAASGKERWGIIEVDYSQLVPEALMPHEGFLLEKVKFTNEDDRLNKAGEQRKDATSHKKKWKESLNSYGMCLYAAKIPLQAILRVVIYDPVVNWAMTKHLINVNIGTRFHKSNLVRQDMTSRWLIGDLVTPEEWVGRSYGKMNRFQRDTITKILQNKFGLDIYYTSPPKKK